LSKDKKNQSKERQETSGSVKKKVSDKKRDIRVLARERELGCSSFGALVPFILLCYQFYFLIFFPLINN